MLAQIVLFDGFDPLDAVAPYEVLEAGCLLSSGALTVELVSAEGEREVPSGLGRLSLTATARLDPERADLIVVPGAAGRGTPGDDGDSGAGELVQDILGRALETPLPRALQAAFDRPGSTVASV